MSVDEEISEAVVMVIGFRTKSSPRQDYTVLAQRFAASRVPDLAARVKAILDELGKVEVDWSKHSLATGGDEARNVMAGRHPELSEEALAALDWKFTFDWR